MKVMHVVAGAALWSNSSGPRFLMGLRGVNKLRPDLWEFPGGKIEEDETPRGALQREWKEELGIHICVEGIIATATIEIDVLLHIELYEVVSSQFTQLRTLDHQRLEWHSPVHAVNNLPCSPAFYLHYAQLIRWLENRNRRRP